MARWRLAVALMVRGPVADEVDGLRRALGDRQLGVIGPHVTLVPPTNVRPEDLPAVLSGVRTAAAVRKAPLLLGIGPPRTFAPANRVLYLAVDPRDAVAEVRDALRTVPFDRPDRRPFVPHVTIDIDVESESRLDAALAGLADYRAEVVAGELTLLREQRDEERGRHWSAIADAAFGAPIVVGRGGIELELCPGTLVDPLAAALLPAGAPVAHDLVVTARRAGDAVGVATADRSGADIALTQLVVAPGERRSGIGRALLAELVSRASAIGVPALTAGGAAAEALGDFLVAHGWRDAGVLRRRLG